MELVKEKRSDTPSCCWIQYIKFYVDIVKMPRPPKKFRNQLKRFIKSVTDRDKDAVIDGFERLQEFYDDFSSSLEATQQFVFMLSDGLDDDDFAFLIDTMIEAAKDPELEISWDDWGGYQDAVLFPIIGSALWTCEFLDIIIEKGLLTGPQIRAYMKRGDLVCSTECLEKVLRISDFARQVKSDPKELEFFVSFYLISRIYTDDEDYEPLILPNIQTTFKYLIDSTLFTSQEIIDLVNKTFDLTQVPEDWEMRETILTWVNEYMDNRSWPLLRKKVKSSSSLFTYVWDQFCSTFGSSDIESFREKARELGVTNAAYMNKAQLCNALNLLKNDFIQREAELCSPDDADPWTMNEMRNIPPYRRYRISGQCYDLLSLAKAVEESKQAPVDPVTHKRMPALNPFTRQPLPEDDILEKYEHVKKLLLTKDDFFSRIRDTPILSKEQIFSQKIGNVWSKMKYPTSVQNFMSASERDLQNVFDSMYSFDVLKLGKQDVQRFDKSLKPGSKETPQEVLVGIMERIVTMNPDEYSTTRVQAMETALNENIESRNQRARI
jgi:hypothetical protein